MSGTLVADIRAAPQACAALVEADATYPWNRPLQLQMPEKENAGWDLSSPFSTTALLAASLLLFHFLGSLELRCYALRQRVAIAHRALMSLQK
jgi:hypothetical protein